MDDFNWHAVDTGCMECLFHLHAGSPSKEAWSFFVDVSLELRCAAGIVYGLVAVFDDAGSTFGCSVWDLVTTSFFLGADVEGGFMASVVGVRVNCDVFTAITAP